MAISFVNCHSLSYANVVLLLGRFLGGRLCTDSGLGRLSRLGLVDANQLNVENQC